MDEYLLTAIPRQFQVQVVDQVEQCASLPVKLLEMERFLPMVGLDCKVKLIMVQEPVEVEFLSIVSIAHRLLL